MCILVFMVQISNASNVFKLSSQLTHYWEMLELLGVWIQSKEVKSLEVYPFLLSVSDNQEVSRPSSQRCCHDTLC